MRKLILVAVVSLLAFLPAALRAEEPLVFAQQQAPATSAAGVDNSKIIAIGAGIVIGAAIASSAMMFRATTVLGAIAGGIIGAWWYGSRADVAALDQKKK